MRRFAGNSWFCARRAGCHRALQSAATLLVAALSCSPAAGATAIDDLVGLLQGTFSSAREAASGDGNPPELTTRHVRVSAPELGSHVLYMQLDSGPEQSASRQRVLVFEPGEDGGEVQQSTWSLAEPERFVDGWKRPETFAGLTAADLVQELPAGCVQRWEKREAGWYGRIDPEKCRIWSKQRQTDLGIEAEVRVTANAYMTAERGFNDKGEKVFGTAPDEYYVLPRR